MSVSEVEAIEWVQRLESLGFAIQQHVFQILAECTPGLHLAVAEQGGDTVYAIDRHVEPIVERHVGQWGDECRPLLLIAEGMGIDGRRRFGAEDGKLRYRVIIDPIDGTRGLMYDKRSAWFLAAVAVDKGEQTSLRDTFASVMVELPTSKQHLCDSLSATSGQPTLLKRTHVGGGTPVQRMSSPSTSSGLAGGFGQVVNFFQGTKGLAAELMEAIAADLVPRGKTSQSAVLDDQYISTGGQMAELILGHDRFCCDLRPLMYQIQRRNGPLSFPELACHPYDAAGLLTAVQSGVIITDGFGRELNAELNVFQPVHWCGYANAVLQERIEPIIQRWLLSHGITP